MKVKIKRGSRINYSVIGAKGFHYPSQGYYIVTEDIEGVPLHWVSSQKDKLPVNVTLPDDPATVMWVNKDEISR